MTTKKEAETFVKIVHELLPEIKLDYSPNSIDALEKIIMQKYNPLGSKYVGESLLIGMGCYLGETIIHNIGGKWSATGQFEINNIGEINVIFPVQKVVKRFRNGLVDSLMHYYNVVCKYTKGNA